MKKLLIADDEEGVRSLVRMTLESEDYEILEAADGKQALEMVRAHRPDLVLLDVMMPEMDGLEACRAIKGDESTASTTVVLLTAKAQEADLQSGWDAGADDYFTKPFSPVALLRKVGEVFEEKSE
jgi:CheY-like chemotaxis protein